MLLSDCPASQSYTLTLNNLSKKYSKDSISFIGIFPGKYASDEELNNFKNTYKINFPLLKDPENSLVKQLHATTAPGCFVIDKNATIIYRGRIDNWFYAVGSTRTKITEHNLDDALQSVSKNFEIKVKETKPIGCILEYE
jgi:peroxiredoxin